MSENKPGTALTAEELKAVGGGDCSPQQYIDALARLRESYETLIEFTSYVIERGAGDAPPAP